jgi:hypothetical protein
MRHPVLQTAIKEPGKVTEEARTDILNHLVPLVGIHGGDNEYDRIRDQICLKYSLTKAQVATTALKAAKKKRSQK